MQYSKNFLSNVVVQFDYAPVKEFFESRPTKIIEELQKQGYTFHQNQIISDVKINIVTGAKIETAMPVWEFVSSDNNVIIELTQNFLKFNCVKYSNFQKLMEHVSQAFSLLNGIISNFNRIGLRYVNQIDLEEPNPIDWKDYIDDSLICSIEQWAQHSKDYISRAMSQIVINDTNDGYTLNFNYGIFNPIYPNPIIQKQFILDFDCYSSNVDYQDVKTLLHLYNGIITQSFEKSIKDSLRTKMEPINE